MEAALKNILDISVDEFSRSQARFGLGINDDEDRAIAERVKLPQDFNLD
jgi:hypothetical protein